MGSPAIFSGKFTKLLTQKGIINSDGSLNQFDGYKNYITYNNFENGLTTGWSLFNTTLTSGLPTGTISSGAGSITTFSTTGTNPIRGSYSLQLASSGVWLDGQGFISDAFTIEREDLAMPITFQFSYEVVSNSTNANWSGQLGSQTFGVYIYDVTNSSWIQPSGFLGMNQVTGVGTVTGSFQSSITSGQQYRLAVIALQASSGAITINFDNFQISNIQPSLGFPVTDYIDYTPTCSWTSGFTITGKYRRVGDTLECVVKLTCTGAPLAASETTFSIPSGFSIDTSKILTSTAGTAPTYGDAIGYDVSTTNLYLLRCQYWTTTTVKLFYQSSSTGQESAVTTSVPPTWSTNDTIIAIFKVPVVGLSSSVEMSNATDTRVVAAGRTTLSSTTITSGTALAFTTSDYDTHGAFTSTSVYTVPVSGFYRVMVSGISASSSVNLFVAINGVQTILMGSIATTRSCAGATVKCNAGQQITVSPGASTTASSTNGHIFIERVSGPSVIAASETVACEYVSTAGNTLTTATSLYVDFPTKQGDTHNAVLGAGSGNNATATSTWRFVAPISGRYYVAYGVSFTIPSASNTDYVGAVHVNGVAKRQSVRNNFATVNTSGVTVGGSAEVQLVAGDYVSIRIYQSSGANRTMSVNANENWVTIVKIGN